MGESNMNPTYLFNAQLEFAASKEGALDNIYNNYFNPVATISKIYRSPDRTRQSHGVDTIITLRSGEQITVQEKWRTIKFPGDFLIEYCSVYAGEECVKRGWIYELHADYLFCVYEPSEIIKIYPCMQLKIAWNNNKDEWLKKYKTIIAHNVGYVTRSVVIPCDILEKEIQKVQHYDYQRTLITA